MREIQLNDRTIRIEDFNGKKAVRVLRTLDEVAKKAPEIQKAMQDYTRQYVAENTIDLDRAYARVQMAPEPLYREEPVVDEEGGVLVGPNGQPLVRRMPMLDENQQVIMGPDPLGHLSEQDWEASGNKLRQPQQPSLQDQFIQVFPKIIELAEEELAKLLGLIIMSNADVKRATRDGSIKEKAAELGDELMDLPLEEIVEVAVVAGEVVQEQFTERIVGKLGIRLTAVLTLFGVEVNLGSLSKKPASETSQKSSTDSPTPTDGAKDELSTELAGAGSAS